MNADSPKAYTISDVDSMPAEMTTPLQGSPLCLLPVGTKAVDLDFDGGRLSSEQRAIEALGAKKDGVIRHHRARRDGTVRDTVIYSILATEWPDLKRTSVHPRPRAVVFRALCVTIVVQAMVHAASWTARPTDGHAVVLASIPRTCAMLRHDGHSDGEEHAGI